MFKVAHNFTETLKQQKKKGGETKAHKYIQINVKAHRKWLGTQKMVR